MQALLEVALRVAHLNLTWPDFFGQCPPHTELTFALTACISVASISRTSFLAGHCSSMATPSLHGERAVCMSWPHLHTGMESIFGLKSHPVRRQTQAFRPFQDGVLSYILAPLTLRPGDQAWGPDLNRRRGGPQQSTESTAHEDAVLESSGGFSDACRGNNH